MGALVRNNLPMFSSLLSQIVAFVVFVEMYLMIAALDWHLPQTMLK